MRWTNPLSLDLIITRVSESFLTMPAGSTGLPLSPHPGAFGVQRLHHIHEGVDLYAPEGTRVGAVEAGEVVAVLPFTGPKAGMPWWLDTAVVLVEGVSGVVAYGEVTPVVEPGARVQAGQHVGDVKRVLRNDKGRPTSMLHLELHRPGTRCCPEWIFLDKRPETLLDPSPFLLPLAVDPASDG